MNNQPEHPIPPRTGGTGEPDSPLDLSAPDWKESLRRAVKEFKADKGTLISAGMAFYWFLAVFPGLLAAIGIMGLLALADTATSDIAKAIRTTLPGDAAEVLVNSVTKAGRQSNGSSVVATVLGIGLALWSASAGMVAMQVGLDVAYDVEEERKFVKKRVTALILVGVTLLLGGVATALIVFGQPIGESLSTHLPFGESAFVVGWTVARWALGIVALTVLFASFYYLGPNRDSPKWSWISPGGVVGVLIWLAASLGFSFYVSSFSSYAETYGSLTGVVVLILWLYLTALAVVVGGEFNAELERQGALVSGDIGSVPHSTAAPGPEPKPQPSQEEADGGGRAPGDEADWSERMAALRRRSGPNR